jgi:hypothetical protein
MSAVRDDGDRLQVSREATREGLQEALRLAMQRYGNRITVNGTVGFKAQMIRAAVDSQLPITFADPALESRRQVEVTKAQARGRRGVPPVGQKPPPQCRHGLRTLGHLDGLHIEGEAVRTVQSAPITTPANIQKEAQTVQSELRQREAKLRAEKAAKATKRQGKKGRGR